MISNACFPASSPSFSLFQRPPSPPPWRNEKPRLRSWKFKPNPTAIREGRTERKTAFETREAQQEDQKESKFGVRPLRVVRDQSLSARANFDTDMLHTRWTLSEMRKDAHQRGLPAPDEACARHHCLHRGVEAPDLATIKDFSTFTSLRAVAGSWGDLRSIRLTPMLYGFLLALLVSRAQK